MRPASTRNAFVALVAPCVLLIASGAQAQTYPTKPVRMIVPFPGGGPTDIVARGLAQGMGDALGVQVVVDNRPGGGGLIGAMLAVKSPPDGYVMFLGGATTISFAPFTHAKLPFDPLVDFETVTQATRQSLMLMVHPSTPFRNVRQYVDYARKHPGQINYASSGPGGTGHLAGELFRSVTGIDLVHIPYKGAPPALSDLMGGQLQSMFGTMLAAVPQVRTGKIRALAVTGATRASALPETPTFAEAGFSAYDASSWNGLLVPRATPRAIVQRLNEVANRTLRDPGLTERLAVDGAVAVPGTPEAFRNFIVDEHAKWAKVIRAAGVKVN